MTETGMSDAFAYLSVLLSIILGLAIAEILQGYGTLLLSRSRVKFYAPPLIWSAILLVLAIHFWWASFGLAGRANWSFAAFSTVLLQTVMLFMGSTVVLPKGRQAEEIDLRAHFYREIVPLFSFGLMFIAVGFLKLWLLDNPLGPETLFFFALFSSVTAFGLIFRQPRVHEIIAPLIAVVVLVFIGLMFARLRTR